jgi:hypothetical protein
MGGRRWGIAVGVFMVATHARAASIDIRCPSLAESSRSELEARAQLLLSSAKMPSASVAIDCEANRMWLTWIDGRRLQIDTSSGIVEGSLDAIEDFLAMGARTRDRGSVDPPAAPKSNLAAAVPPTPPPDRAIATSTQAEPNASQDSTKAQGILDGGVVVSSLVEWWNGSVGVGPRFEVGVRFGRQFAFVLAEGARFGVESSSRALSLDLQGGLSYGAPYATRTGLGVVLLGGAERVAATSAAGGWFAWRATGSLGLRASGAAGSVDVWAGPEIIVRSGATETGGATVPQLSGMLSVGCLFPAFGPTPREPPPPMYAVEQ